MPGSDLSRARTLLVKSSCWRLVPLLTVKAVWLLTVCSVLKLLGLKGKSAGGLGPPTSAGALTSSTLGSTATLVVAVVV